MTPRPLWALVGVLMLGVAQLAPAQAPAARHGFFEKCGDGGAIFELSQGSSSTSANGFGFVTGLGYDIRVGSKVSLSPIANFYFGRDGDLRDGSTVVIPGIKHAIVDFGLSVQYN